MNRLVTICAALTMAGLATLAAASTTVGEAAPAFSAVDSRGEAVSLADFKGRHRGADTGLRLLGEIRLGDVIKAGAGTAPLAA